MCVVLSRGHIFVYAFNKNAPVIYDKNKHFVLFLKQNVYFKSLFAWKQAGYVAVFAPSIRICC